MQDTSHPLTEHAINRIEQSPESVRIGKDGTREEVIEKYHAYLMKNKELLTSLHELDGKVLGCWCKTPEKPETPCHGDVLIEMLSQQQRQQQKSNCLQR